MPLPHPDIDPAEPAIEWWLRQHWHAGRPHGRTLCYDEGDDDEFGYIDTRDLARRVAGAPDLIRTLHANMRAFQGANTALLKLLVMLTDAIIAGQPATTVVVTELGWLVRKLEALPVLQDG